jgi:Xaa-Pro aminopeptidase
LKDLIPVIHHSASQMAFRASGNRPQLFLGAAPPITTAGVPCAWRARDELICDAHVALRDWARRSGYRRPTGTSAAETTTVMCLDHLDSSKLTVAELARLISEDTHGARDGASCESVGGSMSTQSSSARDVIRSLDSVLLPLEAVKAPEEQAAMAAAAEATLLAMQGAEDVLRPRSDSVVTELSIARAFEAAALQSEAGGLAFPVVVAAAANTLDPHHEPTDGRIDTLTDVVVVDGGAVVHGYHCDCTRTFLPLNAPPHFIQQLDAVRDVRATVLDAVVNGARVDLLEALAVKAVAARWCKGVDGTAAAEARLVMPHGALHGIGLQLHEAIPDGRLRAGMAIAVEPGIYTKTTAARAPVSHGAAGAAAGTRPSREASFWLPERILRHSGIGAIRGTGMRIEDVVIVQPSGPPKVLTSKAQ